MKLTKKYLKTLIEQELQNMSYEMAPGTGGEGVSGIVEPQMSMEPDEEEEEGLYSADERAYAAANKPMKIYSMGAGHPYMGTVQESNIGKFKQLVRESIFNLLEGDITREKRYQWDEEEPESADEPEPPPEPDAPPVDLINKAKELHTSLTHYASAAETQPGRVDASQRVVVRTYLRELGEILNELAEHIGPGEGDTEAEARGHAEDDDPGFELPTAPSTRSLAHQRLRKWRNR